MKTVSLPQPVYRKLVKKARLAERFLALAGRDYPIEEYSEKRLKAFKQSDAVSPKLRREILAVFKRGV